MADDILNREEVEDLAFVKLNGDLGRPPTNATRKLLAHDATLREKLERCQEALAFMVECELATVEYMEGLANPTKSQLERHRTIAQEGLRVLRGEPMQKKVRGTPRVLEKLEPTHD